jgi:hypothetical protein
VKTCYEVIGSSYLRIKGALSRDTFKILATINNCIGDGPKCLMRS